MAAPALRATTLSDVGITVDVFGVDPAGAAQDDILIAWLYIESDTAVTPPAGWSNSFNGTTMLAECNNTTAFRMYGYWIRRGASAPDLQWLHASAFRFIIVAAYSGAINTGDPFSFGTFAVRDDATAKTWPNTSGTTNSADELLIWAGCASDAGGAGTPPTGLTEREDISGGKNIELADLAQAAAGGTGTVTGALYAGGTNGTTATHFMGLKSTAAAGGDTLWAQSVM